MNFFLSKVAFSKHKVRLAKVISLHYENLSENVTKWHYHRCANFLHFFVRINFFQARSVKVFDESRMKPFVELVGDFGIFSSQDYPSSYPPNWKQTFRITSKPQTILVIKFQVIRGWSHFTIKVVWFNLFWLKGYSISDSAFAGRLELAGKNFPALKFI